MIIQTNKELKIGEIIQPGVSSCVGFVDDNQNLQTLFRAIVIRSATIEEFYKELEDIGIQWNPDGHPKGRYFYEISVD